MRTIRVRNESESSFANDRDRALIRCRENIAKLEANLTELLTLRESVDSELVGQRKWLKSLEEIEVNDRVGPYRPDDRRLPSVQLAGRDTERTVPAASEDRYESGE